MRTWSLSLGVTRMDGIWNENIRGAVHARRLGVKARDALDRKVTI